ncbi:MAG: recombinase RecA [SAR202 cluster bacterium]|nr:recombinase RecA [SAR202 cluster bacterium]MQG79501.1 recombinase RecA [SAR202 cluster bacterium]|tara:strand:+ start:853 stop:1977 length:1125 start_codon:yes stop_codon:yes gene_type:complete
MTSIDKTEKTDKLRGEALDMALGQIEKDHGKGAVMRLGEIYDSLATECIPTGSLALDIALGIGGIPRGRVTEVFGAESAGKSTLAIHIMAETQKLGGIAAYIDVEHALDPTYAGNCGLELDDLLIAQPDSAEQALDITEQLVRSGAVDAVVVDSVAALVPQAEIEGDMGDTHVGLQARLMSQALRKLTSTIHRSKTAVIFINQLREKIGVTYGSPEVTPGGRALKFYSSVRIDLRRVESIKQGAEVIGNRVRARVVKNKVAAPFRVAEFDIMFNLGISKMGDILEIGVEQGIIKKSGAFYSYGETKLGQGRENSKDFLIQHPEIAASVEGRLRSPGSDAGPEGEAVANDGPAQTKDTVADILSGAAIQEPEEEE